MHLIANQTGQLPSRFLSGFPRASRLAVIEGLRLYGLSQTFLAEGVSAEQHPGHVVRLLELGGADHAVEHVALDEVHQLLQIRHVRVEFEGGQKVLHQYVVLRFIRVKSTCVRLLMMMMRYYGVSVVEEV